VVFDGLFCGCIMLFEQSPPGSIADGRGTGGGIHDIGKEHCHEHSVDIDAAQDGRPGDELGDRVDNRIVSTWMPTYVEIARELDQTSASDVFG
jgi:hypothetical protein